MFFFYVDALPVTPDYAHFTIIEAAKTGDSSAVREGGQYRNSVSARDGRPTGDWTNIDAASDRKDSAKEIPEKRGCAWVALQGRHRRDAILLGRRRAPVAVHV
jgi:hypothetical protein